MTVTSSRFCSTSLYISLERVLFTQTDFAQRPLQVINGSLHFLQNALAVKKDDVSLFTGGEDGVLRSWEFRKTESGCELRLSNHVNLFSCSLLSLLLNPTQNFVFILFFFFIFSAPRCFSKRRNRCD